MIAKIRAAITVLHQGESLTHAATWKNRQNLLNVLLAVFGALVVFLPESLNVQPDDVAAIAGAVAAVAGLFNNYLTTATTDKIGLPSGRIDPDSPGP
jgi:hypothetical protein